VKFQCFAISTVTVAKRTFLCMGVMFQANQKIPDCSHLFYLQFVPFSYTPTVDSEIKKTKSQQLECLFSMIFAKIPLFTLWKVLFVVMIEDRMLNTISVQII